MKRKNIFKNLLFVVLLLITFKATIINVKADTAHNFSLKMYNCNNFSDEYICTDDNGNALTTLQEITSGGNVVKGKYIRLDLYYTPGTQTDIGFQAGVYYDPTYVEPVYYSGVLYFEADMTTTYNGGIWPAKGPVGANRNSTNWSVNMNRNPANNNYRLNYLVSDETNSAALVTAGTIASVYFKVKEDATAGNTFNFTFDNSYTKMNNKSSVTTSNASLKVYKQLDTDATLSSITVTSGGVTYPTKETFSANTTTYNVYVPNNVSTVNVAATPTKTTTTVTGTGNQTLTVSTTKNVDLVATAEDGTTKKTYRVKIYRLDNTNTLSALSLSNVTLNTSFAPGTTSYTASVPFATQTTNVTATATKTTSTVSGTGSKSLAVGSNTVNVIVTPENCKSMYSSVPGNVCEVKTYTVTVTRADASHNANLSDLKVDGVTVPQFRSDRYEYTLDAVANNVSSITIAATAEDSKSTITGTGSKTLSVGNNSFNVVVTAEDGTTKLTYKINIRRKSNDSTLKSLAVTSDPQGSLVPSFASGTVSYTYTVGPDVTEVTITGTANATTATVEGNGTYNPQTTNKAEIKVIAEDESYTTYTVNLVRNKSTNANLSALGVDGYTISPTFASGTTNYTLTVPANVDSVNVTATLADTRASMTGTGNKSLTTGSNTAEVKVTAEDGTTKKTYKITIYRLSDDATLSTLALSNVEIGQFNANTTSYTASVPFTTTTTNVTATAHDSKATVTGTGSKSLAEGANTISVTVSPENCKSTYSTVPGNTCQTKTYTVTVTRAEASHNANLADLKVDGVTVPQFRSDRYEYSLDAVANNVSSITIAATAEDTNATITGTGSKTLSIGNNSFNVVVTAQDGVTKSTYKINVRRKSNDSTLKSLAVTSDPQGSLVPSFASGTITYTYTVGPDVTEVEILGTANATTATVEGNGTYNPQTTAKAELKVIAEDESYTTYTINFARNKSTNANLSALSVDGHPLDQTFAPGTTNYTVSVPYEVDSVNVSATLADERASKTGDTTYSLNVGNNTAEVKVTAEDGVTKKTYKITIRRLNNDATLSTLALSNVEINTFNANTLSYNATVPYSVESTNITAIPNDANALVTAADSEDLIVGLNIIRINVKAEDRSVERTYTINVIREAISTNAKLGDLKVNGQTIQDFGPNNTTYNLTVDNDTDSIDIEAIPESIYANVDGDGTIPLTVGNNPIVITVTAEDGTTQETYTINVTREGNDNNYLSSLTVAGYTLDQEFIKTNPNYTLTVPASETSVNVSATPEVNTSTVAGTGNVALTDDETTIKITVTSEQGVDRDYFIVVTREDGQEYITSVQYGHTIEDGMIKTVEYKTKPETLKDQLDNENSKLHIWTSDELEEVQNTVQLATGMIVKLVVNNRLHDQKTVIVKGDVNGDGDIALLDAVLVLNHYLEKSLLEGPYLEAADVNSDGDVGLLDAVMILNIYLAN